MAGSALVAAWPSLDIARFTPLWAPVSAGKNKHIPASLVQPAGLQALNGTSLPTSFEGHNVTVGVLSPPPPTVGWFVAHPWMCPPAERSRPKAGRQQHVLHGVPAAGRSGRLTAWQSTHPPTHHSTHPLPIYTCTGS